MPITPDWHLRRQARRGRWVTLILLLAAVGVVTLIGRRGEPDRPRSTQRETVAVAPSTDEPGMVGGIQVLSLRGTPREIGREYGRQQKAEIKQVIAEFVYGADGLTLDRGEVAALVAQLKDRLPLTSLDTLEGMAETSGIPFDDLAALQFLPELVHGADGCGYAAFTPATRIRDLLVGYNLDLAAGRAASGLLRVLALDEEGTRAFVGFVLPGMITPIAGMNEKGLCLAYLPTSRTDSQAPRGTPILTLMRHALQTSTSIDEVRQALEQTDRTTSYSLLAAQSAPPIDAGVLTVTPTALGFEAPEEGRLAGSGTADEARLGALRKWLADHAGTLSRLERPLREAGCYTEDSALTITLQPMTGLLGVAHGELAAEQTQVWLQWQAADGVVHRAEADPASGP